MVEENLESQSQTGVRKQSSYIQEERVSSARKPNGLVLKRRPSVAFAFIWNNYPSSLKEHGEHKPRHQLVVVFRGSRTQHNIFLVHFQTLYHSSMSCTVYNRESTGHSEFLYFSIWPRRLQLWTHRFRFPLWHGSSYDSILYTHALSSCQWW